jgi:hypothetical protein
MFKKMCGMENISSVVLVTTFWENLKNPADGERREQELMQTPAFWKDMTDNGSHVIRHTNSRNSAMNIIQFILRQERVTVLAIQKQMAVEGKTLEETAAGIELEGEIRKQRELFEKRLKESEQDMRRALKENDEQSAQEIAAQQERFQKQIDAAEKAREDLKVSFEKMYEEKDKQFKDLQLTYQRESKIFAESNALMVSQIKSIEKEAELAKQNQLRMEEKLRSEMEAMRKREMKQQHREMIRRREFLEHRREEAMRQRESYEKPSAPAQPQNKKKLTKGEGAALAGGGAALGAVAAVAVCTVM